MCTKKKAELHRMEYCFMETTALIWNALAFQFLISQLSRQGTKCICL